MHIRFVVSKQGDHEWKVGGSWMDLAVLRTLLLSTSQIHSFIMVFWERHYFEQGWVVR
ncbi:unnamed protein product [Periconia digitata]|uniref:Uncharacterized protein n=1 Tax=Periconia digitata TaxID=1303443 RepID=A0A9W4UDK8_9PLEO|nr:unnamed protein product [Periconia digitata]